MVKFYYTFISNTATEIKFQLRTPYTRTTSPTKMKTTKTKRSSPSTIKQAKGAKTSSRRELKKKSSLANTRKIKTKSTTISTTRMKSENDGSYEESNYISYKTIQLYSNRMKNNIAIEQKRRLWFISYSRESAFVPLRFR